MKILAIGDIVAKPGRKALSRHLPDLQDEFEVDFTVVNIENAAGGFGITQSVYDEFLGLDIDVMSSGNHIFDKREVLEFIDDEPRLLRPANYPVGTPGNGAVVVTAQTGQQVAVINVMGQAFMHPSLDCPFAAMDRELANLPDEVNTVLVDFHAETTSEKMAMGWYLDGRASGLWGTHTHVQTADERVLPQGMAYISDLGMTGSYNSVIGSDKDKVVRRVVTKLNERFEPAGGTATLCGVVIETDDATGKALHIERIQRK